jgi:hypothetical protein
MIVETIGDDERESNLSSKVWRVASAFDRCDEESTRRWGGDRALMILTSEEALAVPGNLAQPLFHYQEPVLGLHHVDQHLLQAALGDLTDEELAQKLSTHVSTVKKRWMAIFERIARVRPDFFPETSRDGNDSRRGRQKRHRVLAYVREHPEELRPFDHSTRQIARS